MYSRHLTHVEFAVLALEEAVERHFRLGGTFVNNRQHIYFYLDDPELDLSPMRKIYIGNARKYKSLVVCEEVFYIPSNTDLGLGAYRATLRKIPKVLCDTERV